jgi:hypothetical protein
LGWVSRGSSGRPSELLRSAPPRILSWFIPAGSHLRHAEVTPSSSIRPVWCVQCTPRDPTR